MQILNEPEFPNEIVGLTIGNVTLKNPVLAGNIGFNYQKDLDRLYWSTTLLFTIEDIEYDQEIIGNSPTPDPALEKGLTSSVLKRQLTTMFALGLKSKSRNNNFFFVELGPFFDLALSQPPRLGPFSEEVNNFGLGLYTEIGYSFDLVKNYRPEGLVFEIALFSAYNYEVFNVPFDTFLIGTSVGLGYRW
jgi:hypothetical protein